MKIAVGGIMHETNTFAKAQTTLDHFRAYQFARGEEMLVQYASIRNEIGGMLAGARENELQLIPTLFTFAVPSGMVARETYEQLATWLLDDLAQREWDGVLLALHGAMAAQGVPDVEGDLLRRVRAVAGDRPIVATCDLHANTSAAMCEYANGLIGYDTYPHIDPYERGVEAAQVIAKILRGEIYPATAFESLPLLSVPQAQYTGQSPMREIMARAAEIESDARVVTASIAAGFPYADVACAGMSVVVTANGDLNLARTYARELRDMLWARRAEFQVTNLPAGEAVQRAMTADASPVILADVADNIGGGSPGDGTVLLQALLDARAQNAVVTTADAEAVAQALDAGIGQFVSLRAGGKTDALHGAPAALRGRVRLISSGEYVHKGSYMTGMRVNMGRTVVLDCDGVDVVLMERKTMPFDAEQLRSLGIEPAGKKIIVVKSAIAWQAAYGDIAKQTYYVDTPGICTANLKTLPYRNVRRPIFPLDEFPP